MRAEFEIVRLVDGERRVASSLHGVSKHWQGEKESFLFISPHDDDVAIGAGLLVQLAKQEDVAVHILIVTDGSMGYCSEDEKETIAQIRHKETFNCYQKLGVPRENIAWLGFPDCQLNSYRGRRKARTNDKAVIQNHAGLQNAFTYHLRKIRPTQCFLPTSSDLHPDHIIVHEEFLISLFHAEGGIWPELGEPMKKLPHVHEIAVYCNFSKPPQLQINTCPSLLDKKIEAISAFESQRQIEVVKEHLREVGAIEYIRDMKFKLYDPKEYAELFKE